MLELVEKHNATDTTIRKTAMEELRGMTPKPSQWQEGHEIPEKHWMYRFAKKFGYSDCGAYDNLDTSKHNGN